MPPKRLVFSMPPKRSVGKERAAGGAPPRARRTAIPPSNDVKRPGLWARLVKFVVDSDIAQAVDETVKTLNTATQTREQARAQFRSDMERKIRESVTEQVSADEVGSIVAQLMQEFDAANTSLSSTASADETE